MVRGWQTSITMTSANPAKPTTDGVEVVAAAITDRQRVLAARRTVPKELAGLWEFPGGKVEPGETHQMALAREITEELGIGIHVGNVIGVHPIPGVGLLHVYLCQVVGHAPLRLLDQHDQVRWVRQEECASLPWAAGDRHLLPAVWEAIDAGIGLQGVPRDN